MTSEHTTGTSSTIMLHCNDIKARADLFGTCLKNPSDVPHSGFRSAAQSTVFGRGRARSQPRMTSLARPNEYGLFQEARIWCAPKPALHLDIDGIDISYACRAGEELPFFRLSMKGVALDVPVGPPGLQRCDRPRSEPRIVAGRSPENRRRRRQIMQSNAASHNI